MEKLINEIDSYDMMIQGHTLPTDIEKALAENVMGKKEQFLKEVHPYKISPTERGRWRTRYEKDGKIVNKELTLKKDLIDFLYKHYTNKPLETDKKSKSYSLFVVFDRMQDERLKTDNLKPKTVYDNKKGFRRYIDEKLGNSDIRTITTKSIKEYLSDMTKEHRPTEKRLKETINFLKNTSVYACENGIITSDFMTGVNAAPFVRNCNRDKTNAEDKIFTPDEIEIIKADMWKNADNPRARAILLSIETGMRIGEICALHWSDITDDYIHIHRQQERQINPEIFVELPYTKNERIHNGGGRYFPMTKAIREALPEKGDSEYVFSEQGNWITKTSLTRFLSRHCKALGFNITNNHAFRMSLNSNVLIPRGLDVKQRAYVLGHSVETNEKFYTYMRNEELEQVRNLIEDSNSNVINFTDRLASGCQRLPNAKTV